MHRDIETLGHRAGLRDVGRHGMESKRPQMVGSRVTTRAKPQNTLSAAVADINDRADRKVEREGDEKDDSEADRAGDSDEGGKAIEDDRGE